MKGVGTLDVAGSIEESPDGSLIHISARPIMALLSCSRWCAIGVIVGGLFAILDRVVVLPLVMMAVCALPGILMYVVGVLRARTDLCRLTGCLQTMLTARRVRRGAHVGGDLRRQKRPDQRRSYPIHDQPFGGADNSISGRSLLLPRAISVIAPPAACPRQLLSRPPDLLGANRRRFAARP